MIRLEQILTSGRSLVNIPGDSRKCVLEQIVNLVARESPEFDAQAIFGNLVAREKFGSTGFGSGTAIPHCCLPGCQSPISAVLHPDAPVDFDVSDGALVDLLFALLAPEVATEGHLGLLRQVAAMFDHADVRDRLCGVPTTEALYQAVVDVQNGQ